MTQLMLRPLKLTLATMTTVAMSTLSLASWLNLNPRIYLQGKIDSNFILQFVITRKYQETYPKTRKVKVFYEALTVVKKDILGNTPPLSSAREV
jgi:hypothetical protein